VQPLLLWERDKDYNSECVFVTLLVQHAIRMRHILICGQSGTSIFFPHCIINDAIFERNVL